MRDKLGVCQWFHYETHEAVHRAVRLLKDLGVRHLRTGISWADFHRPAGKAWYDFQMEALKDFEVLLSVWHTPPSRAEGGTCASPPRRLADYADFIGQVIDEYGDRFADLELWNEPNNRFKWDFPTYDPQWGKFSEMIARAAETAHCYDRRTVLGGMIPVDPSWLDLISGYGALEHIDVVAIHAFPEMWWSDAPNWDWYRDWEGWASKLAAIEPYTGGRPVWVTETGLASWDMTRHRPGRHALQAAKVDEAALAPVDRVYWYCLEDLDPLKDAIEGFHVDENEYHMGLATWGGLERKPAWQRMEAVLALPPGAAAGSRRDRPYAASSAPRPAPPGRPATPAPARNAAPAHEPRRADARREDGR